MPFKYVKYAMKTSNFLELWPVSAFVAIVLDCHLTRQEIYAEIQLSTKCLGHFQAYKLYKFQGDFQELC